MHPVHLRTYSLWYFARRYQLSLYKIIMPNLDKELIMENTKRKKMTCGPIMLLNKAICREF